jgi:2-keto-4-pentenoate hydratase/2-oxohepta-3-ene-1,7-dioic acid hydratase in catechol pathway
VGDETVSDIGALTRPAIPDLRGALAAGAETFMHLASSAPRHAISEVEWLPPIPNPDKILCVGLNYHSHRQETGREVVDHPTIFIRLAGSQIGHQAPLLRPLASEQFDYEGELAVIVGRPGRRIEAAKAKDHIAGFACYNDASVRDWQRHTSQFTPGKNFPGTGAFGPWLTTPDEISDLEAQTLTTRLNGTIVQQAALGEMIFSIAQIIEYCSAFTSLDVGDVIATGTPGGVGFKRQPPLFLKRGDTVEVEIGGVGRLINGVVDERS